MKTDESSAPPFDENQSLLIIRQIFGLLALVSSYFPMHRQLLLEAIAWLVAFIIPGHILHAKRRSR